jgi:hypothetical protein
MPVPKVHTKTAKATAKKQKESSRVVNQASLDPNNPIPFEQTTSFSFVNNSAYLPFLTGSDDYAQTLLQYRLTSATHQACITTKKDYCAGNGFRDANGNEFDPATADWLSSMNLRNEPALEVNKRIFEDMFTFGNTPVELVRFTVAKKKYLFVYPHNFLEWRLGKPDNNDIVQYAIQSKLFLRSNVYMTADAIKNSKQLPIYNPRNKEKDNWNKDPDGTERTLIWYKNSISGFSYYGLPSSVASLIYQILEYKGARYNLDNFDNNLIVGALLALKGNLSQGEADRIAKKINSTYVGDGKRGRTAVIASEEGIEGSDVHPMETNKDGSFNESDRLWSDKIILANQWDAVLAGIVSPSTLGKGSGFITKIIELKERTVIKPAQNDLMQKVWSTVFKVAKDWMNLPLDNYNIVFDNNIDISGLTDVDITPAVQVNEVRKAKGLPEDESKAGVYMTQMKSMQQTQGGEDVQNK